MDNLTHTLFAFTLAGTSLRRAGRGTTAALVVASSAPDLDIVSALAGGGIAYLRAHRGPTHGLLGVLVLGAAVGAAVWLWLMATARRRGRRRDRASAGDRSGLQTDASLTALVGISMLGVLLHMLMDLPTSYGTRLFSPFSWRWYAADWLPIIDIYLLLTLALGLIFARLQPEKRHRVTSAVLLLMAVNYGLRAASHQVALGRALRAVEARRLKPCEAGGPQNAASLLVTWERVELPGDGFPAGAPRPCLVEAAAIPTFLSPFHWRLVTRYEGGYELREIDLLEGRLAAGGRPGGGGPQILTVRFPDQRNQWVARAEQAPTARSFLRFARFPAARTFTDQVGVTTVRWSDVRFAGGLTTLVDARGDPAPFTVTVRIDASGRILSERLGQ